MCVHEKKVCTQFDQLQKNIIYGEYRNGIKNFWDHIFFEVE